MKRDDVIQTVLVTVAAAGFGAGFAALFNSGFHSGDVFAFSGAIVGAAATVAGATWTADRAANREKRAEQVLIRDDLISLRDVAKNAAEALPTTYPWTDAWRSALAALIDVARGSGRFLDEVINHAATLDFHQREAIRVARLSITSFVSFHDDVFSSPQDEDDPSDERTWSSEIDFLLISAEGALGTFRAL